MTVQAQAQQAQARPTAEELVVGLGLSFDWITPLLGMGYQFLFNCVPVVGTGQELWKMQNAGISCHAPMFIAHMTTDGEYIWQIPRSQVKRAQRILGRRG